MKKVLILEDEVSIRSFVVINLKRAGYEVVEAGTGEEALELLKAVGLGVAMGNAAPDILAVADAVTDTNDRDGVAKALERFVLNQ